MCRLLRWSHWAPLILSGGLAYTWHWYRMLTQLFDYGFNVLLCIVLGALQVTCQIVHTWCWYRMLTQLVLGALQVRATYRILAFSSFSLLSSVHTPRGCMLT